MREIVGDRQRLRPLQQQRVVERHRRRLEQDADRAQHARRHPRLARRRLAIERDERADAAAAAAERKGHHRAGGRVGHALIVLQVRRREFLPAVHHPPGDGVDGRTHVRHQPAIGEHRQLSREIGGDDGPAGRRHPCGGALDDLVRDLRRFERDVDRAHDIDERITPFDAAAQRALEHAQPGREIQTGRRRTDLTRATQLRSALPRGTDGVKERGRHSGGSTPASPVAAL